MIIDDILRTQLTDRIEANYHQWARIRYRQNADIVGCFYIKVGHAVFETELEKLRILYDQGVFAPSFYADRVKSRSSFSSYESFIEIPFTMKQDLRTTSAFDRTATPRNQVYGVFSSSGTTGKKTFYVYSKEDKLVHEEFVRTFYKAIGIGPDDLGGVFAPVDTGVMAHTMMWQFTTMGAGYVNCPNPSPSNMSEILRELPITVVATRPDVVTTMAWSDEWREAAFNSSVTKLLLGGGFLSKERRSKIEKTWNAETFNMFGMSEMFGPMAGECQEKHGQHFRNDYLMIELVDPNTGKPVEDGEDGVAVYTTLWNKGFPLLRYWTDDIMSISYAKCDCGSSYPRIFYKGRLGDCFQLEDKIVFPEMLENILFRYGYNHDYRVERRNDGEFIIYVETLEGVDFMNDAKEEIIQLFESRPQIELVMPGSLHYPGHGKRFHDCGAN